MNQEFINKIESLIDNQVIELCKQLEEKNQRISRDIFKICGDAGILSLIVPKELNGQGLDFEYSAQAVKIFMKRGLLGFSSSIMIQANTICTLLCRYGNEYIKDNFLSHLISGEQIGSLAITEEHGGSDLVNTIHTTAKLNGNEWVINGSKMFITNGPIADVYIVLARTAQIGSLFDLTMFVVPSNNKGCTVIEDMEKLGQRLSPIGHIEFKDCRIPKDNVIGFEGKGYLISADVLNEERVLIGVGAIALAKTCLEKTITILKAKSYNQYQSVRHEIGQMLAELAIGENYGDFVASAIKNKQGNILQYGIVKFELISIAQTVIENCVRLLGASALEKDSWIHRTYTDSRILAIYAGSSETMKDIVGRKILTQIDLL